jgi:hypothetical protein
MVGLTSPNTVQSAFTNGIGIFSWVQPFQHSHALARIRGVFRMFRAQSAAQ